MNKRLKKNIEEELFLIAEDILKQAKRDSNGIYWETIEIDFDDKNNVKWIIDESIYSGTAGIVLFFIELYTFTKQKKYKLVAIEGTRWLEQYALNNSTNNFSFYSGRMGIVFLMLKMYECLEEQIYLRNALFIAKPCLDYLRPDTRAELLSGASGCLLVLLHLYSASKDKFVLLCINEYIKFIIEKIKIGKQGICWDQNITQINGLCGFSHGAAGIAFTFLELGSYFDNKDFYWLSKQAFLYEDTYYNPKLHNWADLRKMNFSKDTDVQFKTAYETKNWDFFYTNPDMNAWCHGSMGIGLSRLRAFELTNDKIYKLALKNCIIKTKESDVNNKNKTFKHSICHGLSGNAFLFIEASCLYKNGAFLRLAQKVAQKILEEKQIKGHYCFKTKIGSEKSSELFMGTAGVGYFYLHLLNPRGISNILYPKLSKKVTHKINRKRYPYLTIDIKYIRETILNKAFPRTFIFLKQHKPEILQTYFSTKKIFHEKNEYKNFISYFDASFKKVPLSLRKQALEIFNLEKSIKNLQDKNTNLSLLNYRTKMIFNKYENLSDGVMNNIQLTLSTSIKIIVSKWNWHEIKSKDDMLNLKSGPFYKILRQSINGIEEEILSHFNYMILNYIKMGIGNVSDIIQHLKEEIDLDSSEDITKITRVTISQIKENLRNALIIEPEIIFKK